jgi:hypothetical protein
VATSKCRKQGPDSDQIEGRHTTAILVGLYGRLRDVLKLGSHKLVGVELPATRKYQGGKRPGQSIRQVSAAELLLHDQPTFVLLESATLSRCCLLQGYYRPSSAAWSVPCRRERDCSSLQPGAADPCPWYASWLNLACSEHTLPCGKLDKLRAREQVLRWLTGCTCENRCSFSLRFSSSHVSIFTRSQLAQAAVHHLW